MLDEVLNNPGLTKYLTRFKSDQIIFLEGDDSQDLYILVSGQVAIFKGDKKIRELTKNGSLFGEVSFFLGSTRTASVRAKNDVSVLRIPKGEITMFLGEFPDAAREITRHLAQWLDENSQILYGLKEFCDQLPDAVILADRDGKILTWNSTAETLYGRSWQQMRNVNTAEIYSDPQAYKQFLKEVQNHYSIRERILTIRHPEKGTRFISTSMTVLYDGHHNFQGILALGRDVTRVKNLEKKYRLVGYRLIGALLLLDQERIVMDAYSILPGADISAMLGSSYAAIVFRGSATSLHKVLILYRTDKNHPMGKKSVEIAFELQQNEALIGWLVFQLDLDQLKKNLGIELEDLRKLQIEKP